MRGSAVSPYVEEVYRSGLVGAIKTWVCGRNCREGAAPLAACRSCSAEEVRAIPDGDHFHQVTD